MANSLGSFIWYELMTTDPDGAAALYGPVDQAMSVRML